MIKTRWMNVTPEMAAKWLEQNTHNRPIRQYTVDRYARDMAAGCWGETHQGLAFNCDDVLVDGQHRLWAIIESGATVRMLVTTGLPSETQAVIDVNLQRDLADVASLSNEFGGKVSRRRVGLLRRMVRGAAVGPGAKLTHHEELQLLREHWDCLVFCDSCFPTLRPRLTSTSVTAVLGRAYYAKPDDRDEIMRFAQVLLTGIAKSQKDSPAILLRDVLSVGAQGGRALHSADCYARTQAALLAFLEERRLRKLVGRAGEVFLLPSETAGYKPLLADSKDGRAKHCIAYRAVRSSGTTPLSCAAVAAKMGCTPESARHALRKAVELGWVRVVPGPTKAKHYTTV